MSRYSTIQQVESLCRGLPLSEAGTFTSTTFVTNNDVSAWVDEAETEIDAVINSIGGTAPYTSVAASSQLGQISRLYGAAMVYRVYSLRNGSEQAGKAGQELYEEYQNILDDIVSRPSVWLSRLGNSTGKFRGHIAHNTKGRSVANGDFDSRVPGSLQDTGF